MAYCYWSKIYDEGKTSTQKATNIHKNIFQRQITITEFSSSELFTYIQLGQQYFREYLLKDKDK